MKDVAEFTKKMAHSRLVRSMVVGGIAVVIQTVLFEILGVLLHIVSASTAVLIGAEAGILTNFYLNNRFSFNDRKHDISLLSRLARFHLVVSGSVLLQWILVHTTERQTDNYLIIHAAYAIGIALGFVWNYTLYFLFVWRHSDKNPN
jgi:putative flippase GtrA